jgi:hypothetical protein
MKRLKANKESLIFGFIIVVLLSSCSIGNKMPDLSGENALEAQLNLAKKGIEVSVKEVHSETIDFGSIVSTTPSVGEKIEDDQVVFLVSKGKEYVEPDSSSIVANPWNPPAEFTKWDEKIAYRWATKEFKSDCRYCKYWTLVVVSNTQGCSSVYGEINILKNERVVDYANDSLGSLPYGTEGVMFFEEYGLEGSGFKGKLTELNCR